MGGGRSRPGRPWALPRESCTEINQLVELVRSWIDESSVPVSQLHQRLTPDHFVARAVPELRRLRGYGRSEPKRGHGMILKLLVR